MTLGFSHVEVTGNLDKNSLSAVVTLWSGLVTFLSFFLTLFLLKTPTGRPEPREPSGALSLPHPYIFTSLNTLFANSI